MDMQSLTKLLKFNFRDPWKTSLNSDKFIFFDTSKKLSWECQKKIRTLKRSEGYQDFTVPDSNTVK